MVPRLVQRGRLKHRQRRRPKDQKRKLAHQTLQQHLTQRQHQGNLCAIFRLPKPPPQSFHKGPTRQLQTRWRLPTLRRAHQVRPTYLQPKETLRESLLAFPVIGSTKSSRKLRGLFQASLGRSSLISTRISRMTATCKIQLLLLAKKLCSALSLPHCLRTLRRAWDASS